MLFQRLKNLHFAILMGFGFARAKFTGERILVGEIIYLRSAGFEHNQIAAIRAEEWSLRLVRKICFDDFSGEFSLGAEHGSPLILL
jgi:hypothetical protein